MPPPLTSIPAGVILHTSGSRINPLPHTLNSDLFSPLLQFTQNLGLSRVKRVLGIMPVSRPQRLPQALSFDEFKGDTGGQPFQCIVADPLNRCVFDILPDRTALTIQE